MFQTVTNMSGLFGSNFVFNQDISGWNTSSVTTLRNTFLNARAFNQNIGVLGCIEGYWDVSNTYGMHIHLIKTLVTAGMFLT